MRSVGAIVEHERSEFHIGEIALWCILIAESYIFDHGLQIQDLALTIEWTDINESNDESKRSNVIWLSSLSLNTDMYSSPQARIFWLKLESADEMM